MDNQQITSTLNELLKGEWMAIQIYDQTKGMQGDEQVLNMLHQFEMDHRRHADQIAQRIEQLGGKAEEDTGVASVMANMTGMVNSLRGPEHLLKQVYDGEDKGVHAYEDRIDELDPESQELIRGIMQEDHDHLKQFQKRMESEKAEH